MALEKQLADTDSIYCTKATSSNQTSIFISNLGVRELEVLFGVDYKSDDKVRLRLDRRNLAFNAVAHVLDGKTWYKRKSSDAWLLDRSWLNDRLAALEKVFTGDSEVFIASLNKDDHSTQRLYLKGMTSLSREDGDAVLDLRDFLFSGDVVVLTKRPDGDVSFEVKIPDSPIVACNKKPKSSIANQPFSHQRIIYGAPGTGKSWRIKNDTWGMNVIRTTFHPDSDYSTFVGAYKPSMESFPRTFMKGEEIARVAKGDSNLLEEKRIVYRFVEQAFLEAYVAAWRKCPAYLAAKDGTAANAATQFLVIEEINRGNCAQIFGDIFQLLDREDDGYSSYAVIADRDLRRFLCDSFKDDAANGMPMLDLSGVDLGDRNVTADEITSGTKLLLPPNLYIWATMNTSDQSLFPIDSAFKRRWEWTYMPICDVGKGWRIKVAADEAYDWWTFLEKANALVQDATDSEDKKLGYFFCKADVSGVITLEQFVGKVVFYLWNDVFKDAGFEGETFAAADGGRLLFKDFFNCDGSPHAAAVRKFMENLGVAKIPFPADGAEVAE